MQSQQEPTSPSVLDKLSINKKVIENNLPWKELGTEEQVERLRSFTKHALADIITRQQKQAEMLERRIQDLEEHRHNDKGEVIVEKVLGTNERKHFNVGYAAPSALDAMPGGYI